MYLLAANRRSLGTLFATEPIRGRGLDANGRGLKAVRDLGAGPSPAGVGACFVGGGRARSVTLGGAGQGAGPPPPGAEAVAGSGAGLKVAWAGEEGRVDFLCFLLVLENSEP